MVAFTDQFERRDPLTFNAYGSVMNLWPRQLAWEARRLVATRSVIDLTEIGRAIDRVVWRAAEATIDRGPRSIAESRQHPPKTSGLLTPREHSARAIGEVRHVDGDLNLYREAGGIGELLRDPALARLIPTDWEAYATIALWKLVDLYEHLAAAMERDEEGRVVSSLYRQDDPDHLRRSRSGLRYASEEAIEAACACTLASEARLRHDIAAVLTAATDQQASSCGQT
ncbi:MULTISPECIES: hypothetical protein [unclassified Rhizobacter]|uniref:hypothetical protein n=1 Tax=unclassified Rhizobacter TaxID=2640088 RepID=UPI0006F5FF7C|nr:MULTISPECIES: hypothetical protein [unclassified Rhizobacter]KQU78172.1 hypothetical protein ASC88_20340 [Rhizobacter sp. Root29]KQW15918.1 hypothetical protein ASC98_01560 [Rhizobacter sp. Root1238]